MAGLTPGAPAGLRQQHHHHCSSSSARSALQLHSTAAAASAAAAAFPFPESARHTNAGGSTGSTSRHQRRSSFGCDVDELLLFRRLTTQPDDSAWQQQHDQQQHDQQQHSSEQDPDAATAAGSHPDPQAFLAAAGEQAAPAAAAAAVVTSGTAAAIAGVPPGFSAHPTWHISSHIRHSFEEALKAGINMAIVHMPGSWQQEQEQQEQQQHSLEHPFFASELQAAPTAFDQAATDAERVSSRQHVSTSAPGSSSRQQYGQQQGTVQAAEGSSSAAAAAACSSRTNVVAASRLTKQIQACRSPAELDELLQRQWQQLDHIHAAAAFVQLARTQRKAAAAAAAGAVHAADAVYGAAAGASGYADSDCANSSCSDSLLLRLQELASAQLPRMQARQIGSVVWACGVLGMRPRQQLLQALLQKAEAFFAAGTSSQGFANVIWGLASIRVCPPAPWLDRFFSASQRHLFNFQPLELSSTVWALASLGVVPPQDWQEAYLAAATAKMGSCSAQALSNQYWAMAKLGLAVSEPWLAAMQYACQIRAAEFTPGGLANLLWAAGMVLGKQQRLSHQQQWQERRRGQQPAASAAAAASSSAGSSGSSQRWLQLLLAAALPQLHQQSAHALANIVWGLAVLEHRPNQHFLQACLSQLIVKAGSLTAAGAACSLWGLSKLGLLPAPQELAPLLQQLQQVLGHSSKQHLVYLAAALAHFKQLQAQQEGEADKENTELATTGPGSSSSSSDGGSSSSKVHPGGLLLPDELQQQYLDVCCSQLGQFAPGQLIQLGRWLAVAGIQPGEEWTDAYLSAAARQLHKLHPGHNAALLRLLGSWRIQPQPGWSAMFLAAVAAEQAVRSYSADTVAALVQGFAASGLQPQQQQLELLLQRMVTSEAGMSAASVAAVLQGLCGLGFRPSEPWLQRFWVAAGSSCVLIGADAAAVAAVAAALQSPQLQQLKMRPSKQWAATYHAAVAAVLPDLQPKQAAAVLTGLAAVRRQPKQEQEQLLPQLMAVAGSGLEQLQLQEAVGAWWCLVEFQVLEAAVPLQQVAEAQLSQPLPAVAAPAAVPDLQPVQDEQQQLLQLRQQQWQRQAQWQAHWLQRLFFSPGAEAELSGLSRTALLQLSDCLGRLQQQVPGSWADAYVAAVAPHLPQLRPHEVVALVATLPMLGGAAAQPDLAASLLAALQPALSVHSDSRTSELRDSLSPAQLSEVLMSLQAAGCRPPEPWLCDYVMAVAARLSAFRGRQLIHVLTSLARLRFVPDGSFLAAASGEAVEKLGPGVPPVLLVDLLWALTALHVRPSSTWIAKFEGRLLEKGLERLDGQQLSRLGWCLAALQRKPGQLLMARYLAAAEAQLPAMDARSLSDTLWACAMLDERPSKQWLDAFFSESRRLLQSFPSSMLVSVLWALALLQQRPPSDWMARCLTAISSSMEAAAAAAAAATARTGTAGSSSGSGSPLLLRRPVLQPGWPSGGHALNAATAGAAGSSSSQQPLSPPQLSRLAWALAALDCQLPASFMQQLLQQSEAAVDTLDADSLAQLLWALDRLDETQEKLWVRRFAAAARARLLPQGPPGAVWAAGHNPLMGLRGSSSSRLPVRPQQAATGSFSGLPGGARLQQTLPGAGVARAAASAQPALLVRRARSSSSSSGGGGEGGEASVVGCSGEDIAAAAAAAGIRVQPDIAAGVSSVVGGSSRKQQLIAKLRQLKSSSNSSSSTGSMSGSRVV